MMNENWPEIVESLLPYFKTNSTEGDYQREIENCLRYLGWKKHNGTMVSQFTLPIGNSNSIRPDITLWKGDENTIKSAVLPIEIKRPSNKRNERQENQLMSYMRQLRLNVGLYIGENIQLYFDIPNDGENPVCVFTAEIQKDDVNGSVICDLLTFDKFNLNKIETFCNEQYKQMQARNNLHKRISEFFSPSNSVENVISLLKEKFFLEGFEESAINDEFGNLTITVHYDKGNDSSKLQLALPKTTIPSQDYTKTARCRDHTKFSFDGINYYVKRRFVLEVIKRFVKEYPDITYKELEKKFPSELHSKTLGVVRTLTEVQEKIITHPDRKKRYFLKPDEVISLTDGTKVVVNNQWGILFPKFLKAVNKLYKITSNTVHITESDQQTKHLGISKTEIKKVNAAATRLKIIFTDGKIIQEIHSSESFRQFVIAVGVERVRSLGLEQCKIPLITNILHNKYRRAQKPLGNGWYLMTCSNTHTKKRTIEQIAKSLDIQLNVEIIQ